MRTLMGVKLAAVVTCVPAQKLVNSAFAESEALQKLVSSIGVESRHISSGELTSDLCVQAAEKLLLKNLVNANDIAAVVFVTQTPDFQIPSSSPIIANRLALSQNILTFDVNQGCSGYVAGLELAANLVKSMNAPVLLLAGDTISRVLNEADSSSRLLFGDGGSASLLLPTEDASEKMIFESWVNGAGAEDIIIKNYGRSGRHPITGADSKNDFLYLNGPNVFSFAITQVPKFVNGFLKNSGKTTEGLKFSFHQANRMINAMLEKKLSISPENVLNSIHQFGNTSSTSIPLSLTTQSSKLGSDACALLVGFGVGLTINGVILNLKNPYLENITYASN